MASLIPDNYLQLGKLGKPFQLTGGLHFYALGSAEAIAIASIDKVFIDGVGQTDIRDVKITNKAIIVYFTAALSIEKAKLLVNKTVYADSELLPDAEDDFYLDDLIGLKVYLEGQLIGEVASVMDAGLQDILTISGAQRDFMIPLQASYVSVEEDGLYLEDVPEGLIDLND